jgi:hypothetical protein
MRGTEPELQSWSCFRCKRSGQAPAGAVLVYHRCTPPPRARRRIPMPEVRHVTREEMRSAVWSGLAEAMDAREPEWMLRR